MSLRTVLRWLGRSSPEDIVAFVDGDTGYYEPDDMLCRGSVQLNVPSSPRGAYQSWIEQTGHASFVTKLAAKPWSSATRSCYELGWS
jgi:hypothetical protein